MKTPTKPRHKFEPPTEAEVADYAAGLNMPEPLAIARQFIECYAPEWRDTFNRPIRNWKMKFRQVWAKRKQHPHQRTQTQKPVGNWML
jgi:hypothetical protein